MKKKHFLVRDGQDKPEVAKSRPEVDKRCSILKEFLVFPLLRLNESNFKNMKESFLTGNGYKKTEHYQNKPEVDRKWPKVIDIEGIFSVSNFSVTFKTNNNICWPEMMKNRPEVSDF